MDYSQIMVEQVGPGHEQDLIRHAMVVGWNELDDGGWDTPFSVALTGEFFGGLERGMMLLVQDMEKNPELKRQMEAMDHWEVYLNDGGYYELTGYREGVVSMKAQVSWNIALVDGWTTSYVEKLQTLADSGENSQQIPEDTRKTIVEALAQHAVMTEPDQIPLAGIDGTTSWTWSKQKDGSIDLQCVYESEYQTGQTVCNFQWANGTLNRIY